MKKSLNFVIGISRIFIKCIDFSIYSTRHTTIHTYFPPPFNIPLPTMYYIYNIYIYICIVCIVYIVYSILLLFEIYILSYIFYIYESSKIWVFTRHT